MATSGVSNFTQTRDQIIARALRQLGAIAQNEIPGASENADAVVALNAMVKEWDAQGLHIWTTSEGILFEQPNQIKYGLGGNSVDHATQAFTQSSLATNALYGDTTLNVTSMGPISAGDYIGIMMPNNALWWTRVLSSGDFNNDFNNDFFTTSPIQLTAPLPAAIAAGALIVSYTTPLLRPLRVIDARRFEFLSQQEIPIILEARLDYRELPNKTTTGETNLVFYDPQLVTGFMWVWPAPQDSNFGVKFTWMRQIQDFALSTNTPDFPQEWINCLTWNLAVELGPEYDVPPARMQILALKAASTLDTARGFDREPESVFFGCNFDQTSR
jgi:hypothetical protein